MSRVRWQFHVVLAVAVGAVLVLVGVPVLAALIVVAAVGGCLLLAALAAGSR